MLHHLTNLVQRYPALTVCQDDVHKAFDLLVDSFKNKGKLLLCGNGGSASDSEHWAGELLKGFVSTRPLTAAMGAKLPTEMAAKLQWALPVIPLTGFPSLATAFSNDVAPDYVFAQLLLALGRPGDVLGALSTSGNSNNVCCAAEVARARGIPVLVLTGRSGGKLKALADVCICAPADETYQVQEFHLPIYHCLCLMVEDWFASTL